MAVFLQHLHCRATGCRTQHTSGLGRRALPASGRSDRRESGESLGAGCGGGAMRSWGARCTSRRLQARVCSAPTGSAKEHPYVVCEALVRAPCTPRQLPCQHSPLRAARARSPRRCSVAAAALCLAHAPQLKPSIYSTTLQTNTNCLDTQTKTKTKQNEHSYLAAWIALSASVIMINKYILDPSLGGFPYPLSLTCTHMAFCWALSAALIRGGVVEGQPMPLDTKLRCERLRGECCCVRAQLFPRSCVCIFSEWSSLHSRHLKTQFTTTLHKKKKKKTTTKNPKKQKKVGRADRRALCRHAVALQRGLPLPQRLLHPGWGFD